MGNESYKSLLLLARKGRSILNKDYELSDYIEEIKISYKNDKYSLSEELNNKKKYIESKIEGIIYNLYSNNVPDNSGGLNSNEKTEFLKKFKSFLSPDVRKKYM